MCGVDLLNVIIFGESFTRARHSELQETVKM